MNLLTLSVIALVAFVGLELYEWATSEIRRLEAIKERKKDES